MTPFEGITMTIEIKASAFPESAKDLSLKAWLKQPGDVVLDEV